MKNLFRLAKRDTLEGSQPLEPDSLGADHLDKYNPGTAGDMTRTIKTKQRTIVYGETPPETRKSQFEKIARRSGDDLKTFARNILDMSWSEKLNLIRQEFSCDKQVVKLLEKAATDHSDQERDMNVRHLSYNNLSLPHNHAKRKRPNVKESRHGLTKSDVSAPLKDETHFYSSDEEDDDNLLAAAFNPKEKVRDRTKSDAKVESESPKSGISVHQDQCTIAKSPEPTILLTQVVKPAPPGQFYKKKIVCDDDSVCDNANEAKTKFNVSSSSTSTKNKWNSMEEDLNLDNIFNSDDESRNRNVNSDKSKKFSNKRVKDSETSCDVDISIDDIFD